MPFFKRFDRLIRQFNIHILRSTLPVKSAASPPRRSVNRRYPACHSLCLTLAPASVQAGHAPLFHLLPPCCFNNAVQSHLRPQP
ncbi:hypothetical protein E2C01_019104 [Portunus trituberculatus]|uniref:Uncharacterized protein n=1 Tax=Portunus trituberculatus TaxID=210409 RepID=A0A5B7DX01_PORTR|nr:hypothetical protein [Portunus trituberculatus]